MIVKIGDKWVVKSKDGSQQFGEYDTEEAGGWVMIPLLWILSAYAFARVFEADTLYQMICYGALFCLSGAALAFMDNVISD